VTVRRYLLTGALALAVLVLALPFDAISSNGGGLWLAFIIPVAVVWILYSVVRMLFKPAERKERAIRLAIWIPTVFLAMTLMQYQDASARETASSTVAAVADFKIRTGAYPKSLADVGLDAMALRSRLSLGYRLQSDGTAFLLYSQPSMPLVAHSYDFQAGKWERFD
jgi:hypothetical protein